MDAIALLDRLCAASSMAAVAAGTGIPRTTLRRARAARCLPAGREQAIGSRLAAYALRSGIGTGAAPAASGPAASPAAPSPSGSCLSPALVAKGAEADLMLKLANARGARLRVQAEARRQLLLDGALIPSERFVGVVADVRGELRRMVDRMRRRVETVAVLAGELVEDEWLATAPRGATPCSTASSPGVRTLREGVSRAPCPASPAWPALPCPVVPVAGRAARGAGCGCRSGWRRPARPAAGSCSRFKANPPMRMGNPPPPLPGHRSPPCASSAAEPAAGPLSRAPRAMAGTQVLRIETRERLQRANAQHVSGLTRDATARPTPEPVVVLSGADYAAARTALRTAPRRTGRKPHEAVELVLAGPPPYDGSAGEPWKPEREREWAHAAYAWALSILGPESVIAAAGWHRDESAPHVHVLAVPRAPGGNGRVGWCATRDAAVARIRAGGGAVRPGSKYRVLQDDLHARVSRHFGLGRGVVGSGARHEAIDRVKALEARARKAERDAEQAAALMVKAHAEHEALLGRIAASFGKEAELDRRTREAQARAEAAEARARLAGEGTHADGVVACFRAVQALLAAGGSWTKLLEWAPFATWAEEARGGVVADVEAALAAERARVAAAAGMAR